MIEKFEAFPDLITPIFGDAELLAVTGLTLNQLNGAVHFEQVRFDSADAREVASKRRFCVLDVLRAAVLQEILELRLQRSLTDFIADHAVERLFQIESGHASGREFSIAAYSERGEFAFSVILDGEPIHPLPADICGHSYRPANQTGHGLNYRFPGR